MTVDKLDCYWNKIYTKKEVNKLGWFEANPEPSIKLINKCKLNLNSSILNVGAGASTLIDYLLNQNFSNIIATDISKVALEKLRSRLSLQQSDKINWIIDDLTSAEKLNKLNNIDLWHDRAVLHFFTNDKDQNSYFNLLKQVVSANGYVIIAVFNTDGAKQCSGLPVYRYNEKMLSDKLGNEFVMLDSFNYTYTMPSGDLRPYVYTLFQRKGNY